MAQVLELEEPVFLIAHERIIDVEESLLTCFVYADRMMGMLHIMVPLDPSAIPAGGSHWLCHRLGYRCPFHPMRMESSVRPLLKHLLKPDTHRVWGFGGLQASHLNGLRDIGFQVCA